MVNVLSLFVLFAMWDAVKDANGGGGEKSPLLFLPFVFAAYFVTIGLIYSTDIKIFSLLFEPVFLPMLFVIEAVIIGLGVKKFITSFIK